MTEWSLSVPKANHSILRYATTSNPEEAEVERFYEDLQDLLELTPKIDVLCIIGDWNAKVGSQEIPGLTGKFDLGVQNEAGQGLTELCQENAQVIANTLFQQKSLKCNTWMQSQRRQNDLYSFPRQTIQYHSKASLCPNQ